MRSLQEKIALKQRQDLELVQKLTKEELSKLSEDLSEHVKNQLDIISKDTGNQTVQVRLILKGLTKELELLARVKSDLEQEKQVMNWWIRKPLLTIMLSVIVTLTFGFIVNLGTIHYLTGQTVQAHREYKVALSNLKKLEDIKGVKKVVENQVWLNQEPNVFLAKEGFWVVDIRR